MVFNIRGISFGCSKEMCDFENLLLYRYSNCIQLMNILQKKTEMMNLRIVLVTNNRISFYYTLFNI